MKIILDTNLLFSAIIRPDGKISEILLDASLNLEKFGCYYSYIELFSHKAKLLKLSKLSETNLLDIMYRVLKQIDFINENRIPLHFIQAAYELTKDIDEKDTIFVALSLHLNCKLWSGDKLLAEGLRKKGFDNIIMTHELLALLEA